MNSNYAKMLPRYRNGYPRLVTVWPGFIRWIPGQYCFFHLLTPCCSLDLTTKTMAARTMTLDRHGSIWHNGHSFVLPSSHFSGRYLICGDLLRHWRKVNPNFNPTVSCSVSLLITFHGILWSLFLCPQVVLKPALWCCFTLVLVLTSVEYCEDV
jgi:hypothetical protein